MAPGRDLPPAPAQRRGRRGARTEVGCLCASERSGGVPRLVRSHVGTVVTPVTLQGPRGVAFWSRPLREASAASRLLAPPLLWGQGRGALLFCPRSAARREVSYNWGWEADEACFLSGTTTLKCQKSHLRAARLASPAFIPKRTAPPWPRGPRPPTTRPRGCGRTGAGAREDLGLCPRRAGYPALALWVGSAPPSTGTCPPCSLTGGGKWGLRSQRSRVRSPQAPKGTRSSAGALQTLVGGGAQGQQCLWRQPDFAEPPP